jgi:hypothetical protein
LNKSVAVYKKLSPRARAEISELQFAMRLESSSDLSPFAIL